MALRTSSGRSDALNNKAIGTLSRAEKGPLAPPPVLGADAGTVAEAVAGWLGVMATVH